MKKCVSFIFYKMMTLFQAALVIGLLGACRRKELTNMRTDDLERSYSDKDREKKNLMILAKIPLSKNGEARSFIIKGEFYNIVLRYANLRPKNLDHHRFFINYQNDKCTKQPIGINKMGNVPNIVAKFLGLPNPQRFTSHSIRHTAASLFVEDGGTMEDLKRLGGWKSETAANGYITHSKSSKEKISDKITSNINLPRPTSTSRSIPLRPKVSSMNDPAGPSFKSSSTASLVRVFATKDTVRINLENQSMKDPAVSVCNRENLELVGNQTLGQEFKLHISNCTNITFHISKKDDS
ncbi:uncharacterized protein LOC107042053 isoform X2 [Diachasma alloeum]|uniref:uncharacterized protein LOC107042053 isoform X2 n=1 Tax=Diachasma alloeum TaxID=454923 RepID=UPI0007381809|nr:uncharacterized protein LOC107042053 isoform X2 [Diachasma alloeum]